MTTGLGVRQCHWNVTMRYSAYDFLLTSISCRFRDIQCIKNVVTLKSVSEVTQGH